MAPRAKQPARKTLEKYGLSGGDWKALGDVQRWSCATCRKSLLGDCMVFVDHEHLPRYRDLPADKKRLAVRGLLCYQCNRFRVAKNTYLTALAVVEYLEKHEDRKRRQVAG